MDVSKVTSSVSSSMYSNVYSKIAVFLSYCESFIYPSSLSDKQITFFRSRQFYTLLQQVPLAGGATYIVVVGAFIWGWGKVDTLFLILWASLLSLVIASNLVWWYRFVIKKATLCASVEMVLSLSLGIGLAGFLQACFAIYLFDFLSVSSHIVLIAVAAATISSGGWMFASLPLAGLLWTIFSSGGLSIGLMLFFGEEYTLLASLLWIYCFVLCVTVCVTARRFLDGLLAEQEIEKQKQVVGFLLKDFEEKSSDWLWEIDTQGMLRHVSVRLSEVTGKAKKELLETSFLKTIEQSLVTAESCHADNFSQLERKFLKVEAFSDVVLPICSNGNALWWSFSARPLFDEWQKFSGWRGVTSDISMAYTREKDMQRLAEEDSLTGLASRYSFYQYLSTYFSCQGSINPCTVLMMDLDNFKLVNDTWGHGVGDALLCEVASRLVSISPKGSIVARLGGDEFALVLPGNTEKNHVELLGNNIQRVLKASWLNDGHLIETYTSIGVTFCTKETKNTQQLMQEADLALYKAKALGRNTLCFFSLCIEEEFRSKQSLLNDLRKALQNEEFFICYQPQINLKDHRLLGFEALLRWEHPTRGVISPLEFIPLAEESGLIIELGHWVLSKACEDAKTWPSHLCVAVNVSLVQVERSDFIATVRQVLDTTGLSSRCLEIEITESVLMDDNALALHFLDNLRCLGIKVALDDFGTGYSSLSYLRSFPLNKLKIDRSFVCLVDQPDDEKAGAIVEMISELSNVLGLETTAEGVETQAQHEFLSNIGVNCGQGYLYGKPMDLERAVEFISTFDDGLDLGTNK